MDFYEEFKKLFSKKPRSAVNQRAVENGHFGDYLERSKNIYLSYFLSEAQDCFYTEYLSKCRDCTDCAYLSSCELCYECVDCSGIYNGSFLQDCHNCSHCEFCFDCLNCKDCFGSFGLRQQQFCIFNKPYTEETYRKKVSALRKNPPLKILEILQAEFNKQPRLYARQLKGGEHSFGDYIYFSKNCYHCFNVRNVSDSSYVSEMMNADVPSSENIDCTHAEGIELCYDCFDVSSCTNCNFLVSCHGCSDSQYLRNCYNCQNCFGCVYLMNKQYCILNRQFTREEYFAALSKILADLKQRGIYGKSLAQIVA